MNAVVAFLSGLLFATGLAIAGMTQPAKVSGFLDVAGDWDPTLMFVMGGGVITYVFAWRLRLRLPAPLLTTAFPRFEITTIDRRLLLGAALFGVGWALSGVCPGPGIVSLSSADPSIIAFVLSMASGWFITIRFQSWRAAR